MAIRRPFQGFIAAALKVLLLSHAKRTQADTSEEDSPADFAMSSRLQSGGSRLAKTYTMP